MRSRRLALSLALVVVLAVAAAGGTIAFLTLSQGVKALASPGLVGRVSGAILNQFDKPASDDPTPVMFTVGPGDTATTVGDRLAHRRLINDPMIFRLLASHNGVNEALKTGDYELRRTMRPSEILAKITSGDVQVDVVTITEGRTGLEIASLLAEQGLVSQNELLEVFQTGSFDYGFLQERPAGATLEGYLFPNTYRIRPGATEQQIVQMMLEEFQRQALPAIEKDDRNGLTVHQIVTLASIVEREAQKPEERPIIASVYLNRLREGMKLDADPTVQYALSLIPDNVAKWGVWKPGLTPEDLELDSPYNTYQNTGLPPGPIANPGLSSIEAVLQPATTDYLYFVAKGDGSHIFAKTLEEQIENIEAVGDASLERSEE